MPWESVEDRLGKALTRKITLPSGVVWLPDTHLDIDEWLISAAETDEEIRELNIPRICFLQNRWSIQKLAQFEWANESSVSRWDLSALYVGHRAYILFSNGFVYQLIAGIEPGTAVALQRAVMSRILHDPEFVPMPPTRIKKGTSAEDSDSRIPSLTGDQSPAMVTARQGYFANLLVGWIGPWINLPVVGYWHEDLDLPKVRSFRQAS